MSDSVRRVLNTDDVPEYVKVTTHYQAKDSQQNRLDSLKFTDQSIDFNSPIEDDQILSMPNYQVPRNKPASVFDDPFAVAPGSSEQMRSTTSEPTVVYVKDKHSSISGPAFFRDITTLTILSLLLFVVIVLEIVGLIALF